VAARRAALDATGTQVAFVHLGTEEEAAPLFAAYGLSDVLRVSDPEGTLYEAFDLGRAGLGEFLAPSVWGRFFEAVTHGMGLPAGDATRMPGVFLLKDGEIVQAFRHGTIADRPDYDALGSCPLG
jgi:hypothetical protein